MLKRRVINHLLKCAVFEILCRLAGTLLHSRGPSAVAVVVAVVSKFCLDEWRYIWTAAREINFILFTPLLAPLHAAEIFLTVIPC